MDEKSKAVLDSILQKAPENLRPDEVAFVQARRDYLSKEQKETFRNVLKQKVKVEETPEAPAAAAPEGIEEPKAPEVKKTTKK